MAETVCEAGASWKGSFLDNTSAHLTGGESVLANRARHNIYYDGKCPC